ncbi:MAG: DUF1285 domain-containing protein [Gammaproteobacteria bacterium]|nr:DUF1285 domain-containing protein [Gammaproteobacteria bacterium]
MQNANSSDPLALSRHIKQSGPAPVHLWDPPFCGDMDMRIARDGTWYHEGSPIRRDALVKLFSSVLKKEDEKYFLVTPVEKVGIQVDDCPFVVRTAEISGAGSDQRVSFVLNTGEQLPLDEQHYLSIGTDPDSDEPHPTVHVRSGLFALLSRSVFYQLVEAAESRQEHGQIKLGICSAGHFFELGEIKP